jgi:hypothetical protein
MAEKIKRQLCRFQMQTQHSVMFLMSRSRAGLCSDFLPEPGQIRSPNVPRTHETGTFTIDSASGNIFFSRSEEPRNRDAASVSRGRGLLTLRKQCGEGTSLHLQRHLEMTSIRQLVRTRWRLTKPKRENLNESDRIESTLYRLLSVDYMPGYLVRISVIF